MLPFNTFLNICFVFISFHIPHTKTKKYDIEVEAMKLYGEDFYSVLRKFRKSPEYLHILQDKYEEIDLLFGEIAAYELQHILDKKLKKKVAAMCGYSPTTILPTTTTKKFRARRTMVGASKSKPLRTDKGRLNEIEVLDQYYRAKSRLSSEERNYFRDLGFQMSHDMIKSVIKGMDISEYTGNQSISTRLYDSEENSYPSFTTTTTTTTKEVYTTTIPEEATKEAYTAENIPEEAKEEVYTTETLPEEETE